MKRLLIIAALLIIGMAGVVMAEGGRIIGEQPSEKWTGFKILTITIDEPYADFWPYKITNTSTDPVCFSYSVCEDDGEPNPLTGSTVFGATHKQHCVVKAAKLNPGKTLEPDQNYGLVAIMKLRTCT